MNLIKLKRAYIFNYTNTYVYDILDHDYPVFMASDYNALGLNTFANTFANLVS